MDLLDRQDASTSCASGYTGRMPSESTLRIRDTLARIPYGKVISYGQAARLAGHANGARQVVRVLHSSAEKEGLPWHRLLRRDGSIALKAGAGLELQKSLLEREGVEVSPEGKVDMGRFGWSGG